MNSPDFALGVRTLNVDLHCHSAVSDGTLSPTELAARAHAHGVAIWSLTDHDEIGGQDEAVAAATKKHLLRDRSYAQLSEEVKKGLRKEGIDVSFFPPGKNGTASSVK